MSADETKRVHDQRVDHALGRRREPTLYIETTPHGTGCEIGLHDTAKIGCLEYRIVVCAHRATIADAAEDFRQLVAELPEIIRAIDGAQRAAGRARRAEAMRPQTANRDPLVEMAVAAFDAATHAASDAAGEDF
jgi:hypothetical protein